MDLVVGGVAVVMLALLLLLAVLVVRNRSARPAPAGPSPLATWGRGRGVLVVEPAPEATPVPTSLAPARMEAGRCLRQVGDPAVDGFAALTWRVRLSNLGGLGLDDDWTALTVPAPGPLPELAVAGRDEIVHLEMSAPRRLGAGPLVTHGPVAFLGAPPDAQTRLAGLAERVAATGAWVVTGAHGVGLTRTREPGPEELESWIALAREVASALRRRAPGAAS